MEWQAQEAPQTPGENTVTLEGPCIPGEEGVKEGVKLESTFDEVAEGGGGEGGDADGGGMEVTYAAGDLAAGAAGTDVNYDDGNAREGQVECMEEDGATAAASVGVPHSAAGACVEEGGGAQALGVCVIQQEEDLSEPVVVVNHAEVVVAPQMIGNESGGLIDGTDGASAAAAAGGGGAAASGGATFARPGIASSGNGNRITDGSLAQSGGAMGKTAGAGSVVGEKVEGRLEGGGEAPGTAASAGTPQTVGGGSKGTAAAVGGGAAAGGGKAGSGRGRGGGAAGVAVASTSGTSGGAVGGGRGRKAQHGEGGQAQAKTPAKRMKKLSAGPAGEADGGVVGSAKTPAKAGAAAAAVSSSPAQQQLQQTAAPPPPPPSGSAEKASPAPGVAMAAPSAKPAAKRLGSSPMSVTYAVQCGRCHKWRRVTSVEEYEKIRARSPADSSWVCGEAAGWKKNGGNAPADGRDYCAEPSELEPDGRLTWALDKPHIPRTPPGWRRRVAVRGGSAKKFADVYYYSPCNKQLRSIVEVERFLLENPSYKEKYGLTKDNFSFAAPRAYPVGSPMAPKSSPMNKDATVRSGDGMIVDSATAEQDKKDRSASAKAQTPTVSSGGTVARSGGAGSGARNGTVEGRNTSGEQSIGSGDRALSTPVRGGTGHGSGGKTAVEGPGAVVAHRTPLLPPSLVNNAPSSSHADMLSPSSQFHVFGKSLTECPPTDTSVLSDVQLPSGELPLVALPQPADVSSAMATEPDFIAGDAVEAGEPVADGQDGLHCEMANGEGGKVADGVQDGNCLAKTDGSGTENGGDGQGQCG